MNYILSLVETYPLVIFGLILIALSAIIIVKWWDRVKLFVKSFWYSLPLIGKVSRLSRRSKNIDKGWFPAEKELCADFKTTLEDILPTDVEQFKNAQSYLELVKENGRDFIGWFWLVIVTLVFIESVGFAFVLSGYTIPGASPAVQEYGAYAIALLISIVLVFLTHQTGAELHKRDLVQKCRIHWSGDTTEEPKPKIFATDDDDRISNPDSDNNKDKDKRPWRRLRNRLNTNAEVTPGMMPVTIITFLAIVGIASGATYVRIETYNNQVIEDRHISSQLQDSLWEDDDNMPSGLSDPQKGADKKAQSEAQSSLDGANYATYVILAFLFVLVQIMGIIIGKKRGFAGIHSAKARRIVGSFNSGKDFERWHDRKRLHVINVAQKHLSSLQTRLQKRLRGAEVSKEQQDVLNQAENRTFVVFLANEEATQQEKKQNVEEKASVNQAQMDNPRQSSTGETKEQRDERLRQEVLAEMQQQAVAEEETEEQARERVRQEMRKEMSKPQQ